MVGLIALRTLFAIKIAFQTPWSNIATGNTVLILQKVFFITYTLGFILIENKVFLSITLLTFLHIETIRAANYEIFAVETGTIVFGGYEVIFAFGTFFCCVCD
jgi:hypothetical protein